MLTLVTGIGWSLTTS